MIRVFGATIVAVLSVASTLLAQSPTLDDVLARAGAYAANYSRTLPVLVADERADEVLRGFGVESSNAPGMEGAGHTEVRLLRGTIVIEARGGGNGWQAYRDIHEANTRVLHPKDGRLEKLFREPTPAAASEIVAITEASRRWKVGSVPRIFDIPVFSMMFLLKQSQHRFAFRRNGEKKVDGETVWIVGYEETTRPAMMVTTLGDEYPVHGELWIEPTTGRLVKSKMIAENVVPAVGTRSGTEVFRPRIIIDVTYQNEPTLNVWLPSEMKQLYVKAVEQVTCTARYSNFRVITSGIARHPSTQLY